MLLMSNKWLTACMLLMLLLLLAGHVAVMQLHVLLLLCSATYPSQVLP
jgi:hypothetical protein